MLAHEANIDARWDGTIAPLLLKRFPEASREQVQEARGYAYGGCVIQDLGYYPFGSRFSSNLLHYVRAGDFVDVNALPAATDHERKRVAKLWSQLALLAATKKP